MMELQEAKLGFGSVVCSPERPELPTTHEKIGDDVHINISSPAQKAYCEVQFKIECSFGAEDELLNTLFWNVRLEGDRADAPYSQVEGEAARLIAPMLRAVADAVQKRVEDYDASRTCGES